MTPRQSDCLRFIRDYQARHDGVSPSLDEIATHLELASKSGAHRLLIGLEQLGRIRHRSDRARDIKIIEQTALVRTDLAKDMATMLAIYGRENVAAELGRQTERAV